MVTFNVGPLQSRNSNLPHKSRRSNFGSKSLFMSNSKWVLSAKVGVIWTNDFVTQGSTLHLMSRNSQRRKCCLRTIFQESLWRHFRNRLMFLSSSFSGNMNRKKVFFFQLQHIKGEMLTPKLWEIFVIITKFWRSYKICLSSTHTSSRKHMIE